MGIVELSATVRRSWQNERGLKMRLHDADENVLDVLEATSDGEKVYAMCRQSYTPWIRYAVVIDKGNNQLIVATLMPQPNQPGHTVEVMIPSEMRERVGRKA